MEEELTEMVESIIERIERNKYYSAIGFFQGYSNVEADSSGKRFCQVKLHNKDKNAADISIEDIPIGYPGTKRTAFQDDLEQGDELLLFFTDRSLEEWKDSGASGPQLSKNTIRNQRSNAFALPVSTHHDIKDLNLPDNDHARIALAQGKKIQIGILDPVSANKKELLDIVYQLMEIVSGGVDPNTGSPIGVSGKGKTIVQLIPDMAIITDIT